MVLRKNVCFLVVYILTISKLTTGLRTKEGRWKYCHDKYRPDAPNHDPCELQWPGICQTGKHQSPIDLAKKHSIKKEISEPWVFKSSTDYYPVLNVENNGHSVKVSPDPNTNEHYTMSGVSKTKIS